LSKGIEIKQRGFEGGKRDEEKGEREKRRGGKGRGGEERKGERGACDFLYLTLSFMYISYLAYLLILLTIHVF